MSRGKRRCMGAARDLQILPIGVDPHSAIPIHYNDYTAFKSPLEDFKKAVSDAGLEERVHYLEHGETYEFQVPGAR